ncbi:MAG: VCBS repeat-containing protein [Bryobacterales bacterium]|nr:VCBS repeat-containing protein [Bryobacterales bacterium]
MIRYCLAALLILTCFAAWSVVRPADIPFEKYTLDLGANETAAIADINGDGRPDIVAGENWFEAPRWARHRFRSINFSNNYIDNFADLPVDVNGDGHIDIVSCSWFSKRIVWMENPGRGKGEWREHPVDSGSSVEFAFLVDLDNDGKARELLPQYGPATAPTAWFELVKGAWVKHEISPGTKGHGIGAGDVNGDKRADILTPKGWFEAPADPRAPNWTWHGDFDLESTGFMHVLDVNGDGRNDIVTSLAHNYGFFWMEQTAGGWARRMIDDSWSQPHAVTMVDLNRDGRMDFVTGKRFMAHNGRDPGEREPLGVYWFEYLPGEGGKGVEWVKHIIDYSTRAGGGMQIAAGDLDGDGDIDLVTPGKSGLFRFVNLTK